MGYRQVELTWNLERYTRRLAKHRLTQTIYRTQPRLARKGGHRVHLYLLLDGLTPGASYALTARNGSSAPPVADGGC